MIEEENQDNEIYRTGRNSYRVPDGRDPYVRVYDYLRVHEVIRPSNNELAGAEKEKARKKEANGCRYGKCR